MSVRSFLLSELAKHVSGAVRGDGGVRITGVNSIEEAGPGDITWLTDEKYAEALGDSQASAVVVPQRYGATPMPAILADDPAYAFALILEKFAPPIPRPPAGIHPSAVVAESAEIGEEVAIGPHVVVGERARIGSRSVLHAQVFIGADTVLGEDCELWPGVVVRERCTLGRRVVIHPSSTIGADGFGYHFTQGRHHKIPQIGRVEIGDEVEIGAGCAVDRAKFGATRIGAGTKIDNQVQVAHNVQIGPGCIIVAQTGLAGSVRVGRGAVLAAKVGIGDHLSIGEGAVVAACSCVSKNLRPGARVVGIPAVDMEQFIRERGKVKQLPRMAEQLRDLIKRVEQLETSTDD